MMKDNHIQKEELLEKLTEIYDQLEELEKAIDTNLSEHRKKLINDQSAKLMNLDARITKIEDFYDSEIMQVSTRKTTLHRNSSLKLELGF
jgi:uncharacterized protein Yka (UPF0111/DUF47 family)